MTFIEALRRRLRTANTIVALLFARMLVAAIPFKFWRGSLGTANDRGRRSKTMLEEAEGLAARVNGAAKWFSDPMECLPRAMVLSWMLRRRRIAHSVVFAVRPAAERNQCDDLHAWIEIMGNKIIGDLLGPWIETLRLGDES